METGCDSLHRLKHKAVIALIIVCSLLFYIICIHIHYFHRTLEIVGALKNVDREVQQTVLYHLFTGSINCEDGKYVLMKNGYQISGQYFLFFDTFTIIISIVYLIIMTFIFCMYKKYINKKIVKINMEFDYLKNEIEHFLFNGEMIRNNSYKECNYLLDRLRKKFHDANELNEKALKNRMVFHQNIIHQINTPLNTIKILVEDLYNQEKIDQNYIMNMNFAIQKVSDLAHVYLRSSKFDIGKIEYHFEEIKLKELIDEILNSINIYAEYYHVKLVNNCDNSFIFVDSVWLKEAIENIIKNSIENIGEHKEVVISSKTIKDFSFIWIDDNCNLKTDIKEIKFERFESSPSGIGIGLHLSKQIVEVHLGDLSVENSPLGGLRFIIKIPRRSLKNKTELKEII